ncbi:MAG: PorV/PorQ family protein [Bacteroidales bacterium]|nr:PorV/PorQ family protein [Bacteroidales bacterium]
MRKLSIYIGLFLFALFNASAQHAPKYSNEFLSIGVGARALGMSNSNVAIVDDVTAGFWNPAGLLRIKSNLQVGLMHASYFANIAKYDYGSVASRIDSNSCFAVSIIRFGIDDIPNTIEMVDANGNINYDNITTFSDASYAFIFSYAKKTNIEGLTIGANAKIIHRKTGDFATAWGFGLDAAAQFQKENWYFGIMGKDITSTFNAWRFTLDDATKAVFQQTGNEIPKNSLEITLPKLIFSAARNFEISNSFSTIVDMDFDMTFDKMRNVLIKSDPISIDPHLGLEIAFKKVIFIRGGIGNIQKETDDANKKVTTFQPNIGVGICIKNRVCIDYALTDVGDNSIALYSNIFSLKINFNKTK